MRNHRIVTRSGRKVLRRSRMQKFGDTLSIPSAFQCSNRKEEYKLYEWNYREIRAVDPCIMHFYPRIAQSRKQ